MNKLSGLYFEREENEFKILEKVINQMISHETEFLYISVVDSDEVKREKACNYVVDYLDSISVEIKSIRNNRFIREVDFEVGDNTNYKISFFGLSDYTKGYRNSGFVCYARDNVSEIDIVNHIKRTLSPMAVPLRSCIKVDPMEALIIPICDADRHSFTLLNKGVAIYRELYCKDVKINIHTI